MSSERTVVPPLSRDGAKALGLAHEEHSRVDKPRSDMGLEEVVGRLNSLAEHEHPEKLDKAMTAVWRQAIWGALDYLQLLPSRVTNKHNYEPPANMDEALTCINVLRDELARICVLVGRSKDGSGFDVDWYDLHADVAALARSSISKDPARDEAALEFWRKHALGSMMCPSCLLCGHQRPKEQWAVRHAELPDIYICEPCVTVARSARAVVPLDVWAVENKTSFVLFDSEAGAKNYLSSFPASIGGGMSLSKIRVMTTVPDRNAT